MGLKSIVLNYFELEKSKSYLYTCTLNKVSGCAGSESIPYNPGSTAQLLHFCYVA